MNHLVPVHFRGDRILVTQHAGKKFVVLRPIVEALG